MKRIGKYPRWEWARISPRARKQVLFKPNPNPSEQSPFKLGEEQQPNNNQTESGQNETNSIESDFDEETISPETPNEDEEDDSDSIRFELDEQPKLPPTLPGLILATPGLIVREFDNFYDFVSCAADNSLHSWGKESHAPERKQPWYATDSFDEAVEMAIHRGWPEGRKLLNDALIAVSSHPEPFRSIQYDVGGIFPIIPLYVAGDPACMIEFQNDHIATRPIVRIDYDAYTWDGIDASSIMLYGAAVLSLATNLESQGYSVELRMFYEKRTHGAPNHRLCFTYKRAGENFDLDRAAFALAHPSVHRRFEFAILEQSPVCQPYSRGYGAHSEQPLTPRDPLTIYIPFLDKKDLTPDEAKERIQTAAQPFLIEKDLAA